MGEDQVQEVGAEVVAEQATKVGDNSKEYNFANVVRQRDAAERRSEFLEQQLAFLQNAHRIREPEPAPEPEFDLPLEEVPTWEHVKKREAVLIKKMRNEAKEEARKELEALLNKREAAYAPEKLRNRYADYDDVVTEDNVAWLKETKPEIAASLAAISNDPYRQGVAAYDFIKTFKSSRQVPKDINVLEKNNAAPKSAESMGGRGALHNLSSYKSGGEMTREERIRLHQETRRMAGQ